MGLQTTPSATCCIVFKFTNSTAEATHGSYAVEVLHNGVWFNALPQPKGVDDLIYLPAWTGTCFSVPAPIGRAEEGLKVQANPPGEKWRTYFSYATSRYPQNIIGRLMERLSESIGHKNETKGRYAFSPKCSSHQLSRRVERTGGSAALDWRRFKATL